MTGTLYEDQYTLSIVCRLIFLRMTSTLHEDQYTLSIYLAQFFLE